MYYNTTLGFCISTALGRWHYICCLKRETRVCNQGNSIDVALCSVRSMVVLGQSATLTLAGEPGHKCGIVPRCFLYLSGE